MSATAVWHGTSAESTDLVTAFSRNCTCKFGAMGMRQVTCPVHEAMIHDQRFLDGVLFMRNQAARLWQEEFEVEGFE